MTLEPKKRKFVTVSIVPASICYEAMEQDAVIPVIDYLFIKNNPKQLLSTYLKVLVLKKFF